MFNYVLVLRPSRNEDSSQSVCKPESRAMDSYGSNGTLPGWLQVLMTKGQTKFCRLYDIQTVPLRGK